MSVEKSYIFNLGIQLAEKGIENAKCRNEKMKKYIVEIEKIES